MAYYCPRDSSSLNWVKFLFKGRWNCESCNGALLFDKHLQIHSSGPRFLKELQALPGSTSKLKCPLCGQLLTSIFLHTNSAVEIDRCNDCKLTWFDPGEIKHLSGGTAATSNPHPIDFAKATGNETSLQTKLAETLLELYDHSGDRRWKEMERLIRLASAAIIAIALVIAVNTFGLGADYYPRLLTGRAGSSSPLGYAVSAVLFSSLAIWKPRSLWIFALMGMIALGQSLLSLAARY